MTPQSITGTVTLTERLEEFGNAVRRSKNLEIELPELLALLSRRIREVASSHEEFTDALDFLVSQAPDVKLRNIVGKFIEDISTSKNRPDFMMLARKVLVTT